MGVFNTKCPLFDSDIDPNEYLKVNTAGTKIISSGLAVVDSDLGWQIPAGTTKSDVDAAISACSGSGVLYLMPNWTHTITDDLTIASGITVYAPQGASFSVSSGKTLTINGTFTGSLSQHFSGSGTVTGLKLAYPEWFGPNTTPGTTDMTDEINYAVASVASSYGTVRLQPEIYRVSATIALTNGVHFLGASIYDTSGGTRIYWYGGNSDNVIELAQYNTISDVMVYNANRSTGITAFDMVGSLGDGRSQNVFHRCHAKAVAVGYKFMYSFYNSLYDCISSYNDLGYDLQTEANNINFYNCHSNFDGIAITDANGIGSRQMLWSGGSIEGATTYGIQTTSNGSNAWYFLNPYFESNYQHFIGGQITIEGYFMNHDGGSGTRPPFDINLGRNVRLSSSGISFDITQLFTLSAAESAYAPGSIFVRGTYSSERIAISASLWQSDFLMHGYINSDTFQVIETEWLDASSAQLVNILTIGELWKHHDSYILDAYLVVDTRVVVIGSDWTVSMGRNASTYNNYFDETFTANVDPGVYRIDAASGITTATLVRPDFYTYKVKVDAATSGKYKVVFITI